MGVLEAPKGGNAPQLEAGKGGVPKAAPGDEAGGQSEPPASAGAGSHLTADDLKELEDLDLSELEAKLNAKDA